MVSKQTWEFNDDIFIFFDLNFSFLLEREKSNITVKASNNRIYFKKIVTYQFFRRLRNDQFPATPLWNDFLGYTLKFKMPISEMNSMSKFSCLTGHPVEVKIILNCAHSKTLKSVTEIYTPNPGIPRRNFNREREEESASF